MTKELTDEIEQKLMDVWDAGYMAGVSDAANGKVILPDTAGFRHSHCGLYSIHDNELAPKALEVSYYLRKCVDEVLHIN